MTTIYSGTYDNLRTRCDYTISSNATSVTISGTIYLQHKGAAATFSYFQPTGLLTMKTAADIFDTNVASTGTISSVSKHTDWTTVKSKTYSKSIAKDTYAVTYTFKVSVYDTDEEAVKTFTVSVPALASYAITYYPNGGSGGPAKQTKYYGRSVTLADAWEVPTRTDYSFYKWNTASDGTGTYYNPGDTYTGNAALNLYAIWNPQIKYNQNGRSAIMPSTQTKTFNQSITLSEKIPSEISAANTSHTFYKWNTKADGTGTYYDPGGTYTGNTALTLYAIWNNVVSFNGNGGQIPFSLDTPSLYSGQRKIHDQDLTLLLDTPTRSGYAFSKWNTIADGTGTDYSPGGTYSSNSDITLYALWLSLPAKPQITSMTAIRWNETTGEQDDTGTSAKVTAEWSIDTTSDYYGNTNTGTVTLLVTPQSGSSSHTITPISGTSGTSGTAVFMVSGLDTDMQYTCKVTVTDLNTSSNRSVLLTRAFFIMDFKAGGNGIGIGRAAPDSGLEIGYDVTCDQALRVYGSEAVDGNLTIEGITTHTGRISANGNIFANARMRVQKDMLAQDAEFRGDLRVSGNGGVSIGESASLDDLYAQITDSSAPTWLYGKYFSRNYNSTIGSLAYNVLTVKPSDWETNWTNYYLPKRTDGLFKCTYDVDIDGALDCNSTVNIDGALDCNSTVNVSGDIYQHRQISKVDIDINNPPTTSNTWKYFIDVQDKNDNRLGDFEAAHLTDGRIGISYGATRNVNGTETYNWLTSYISDTGVRSWGISELKPFLSMLGLTTTTPTGSISTTAGTLNYATFKKCGNVVTMYLSVRNSSSIAAGSNIYTGTLNTTSLRPAIYTAGTGYYGSYGFTATIGTTGAIIVRNTDSRAFAGLSGSNWIVVTITYIVP